MPRIRVVRPNGANVLNRIAEQWSRYLPEITTHHLPDPKADVNLWCNYAMFSTVGRMKKNQCDVGYFTHREADSRLASLFDCCAREMDFCVCMSNNTVGQLPDDVKRRPEKWRIVPGSPHEQFIRGETTFGVCCTDRPGDPKGARPRKRLEILDCLAKIAGAEIKTTGGRIPFGDMPGFFQAIDYLVVLADNEGGPLPVLEALAQGVPVIAPNVGWCWDWPVIRYSSLKDLLLIVHRLIVPETDPEREAGQIMDCCMSALELSR